MRWAPQDFPHARLVRAVQRQGQFYEKTLGLGDLILAASSSQL